MTTLTCVVLSFVFAVINAQNPGAPQPGAQMMAGGNPMAQGQAAALGGQSRQGGWNPTGFGAGPLTNPMGGYNNMYPPQQSPFGGGFGQRYPGATSYQRGYGRQRQQQQQQQQSNSMSSMMPLMLMGGGNDAMRNMFLMSSMMGGGRGGGQGQMFPLMAATGMLGDNMWPLMAMGGMGGGGGGRGGFNNPALMYTMMNGGEMSNMMLPLLFAGQQNQRQGGRGRYGGQQRQRSTFEQTLPYLLMGGNM